MSVTHYCNEHHNAHRLEYTPGIRASVRDAGNGDSQRSGFHSSASSPHISLAVLHDKKHGKINVPFGIGSLDIIRPSTPQMGFWRGMATSVMVLRVEVRCYIADADGRASDGSHARDDVDGRVSKPLSELVFR